MYENLALLRTADQMARHAGARQALVARNMANSDTPGYRASTIAPFAEAYEGRDRAMRATRAGHLGFGTDVPAPVEEVGGEASPNGNTVSLEMEMIQAASVEREHTRALAVYRHTLTVLRTVISGR